MKYEIICVDSEGDRLKLEVENDIATLKDSNKFTVPISGDKLKKLSDSISGITTLLYEFKLKSIEVKEL